MRSKNTTIKLFSWSDYGFSQGDEFKVFCMEEGKVVLEKKQS